MSGAKCWKRAHWRKKVWLGLMGSEKENKVEGKKGGGIAPKARRDLEDKTGRSVVTGENFLPPEKRKLIDE